MYRLRDVLRELRAQNNSKLMEEDKDNDERMLLCHITKVVKRKQALVSKNEVGHDSHNDVRGC